MHTPRKGSNLDKLIQHWPACPTKYGRDVLPSIGDQILQTKADLLAAMQTRMDSFKNLDAEGFPNWPVIADELRSPPGAGGNRVPTSLDPLFAASAAAFSAASSTVFLCFCVSDVLVYGGGHRALLSVSTIVLLQCKGVYTRSPRLQ